MLNCCAADAHLTNFCVQYAHIGFETLLLIKPTQNSSTTRRYLYIVPDFYVILQPLKLFVLYVKFFLYVLNDAYPASSCFFLRFRPLYFPALVLYN